MNKLSAFVLPVALLFSACLQAENLIQSFALCKKIPDNQQRLACFDAIDSPALSRVEDKPRVNKNEQSDKSHQASTNERSAEQARSSVIDSSERDDFGLPPKPEEASAISAVITELAESARGQLLITLENGSQWQQKDSQSIRLKVGTKVTVERGMLGSYHLSKEGANRRIKVKRIK